MKQTKLKKSLIVPAVALCLTLAQPTPAQTVMVANAAQTNHSTTAVVPNSYDDCYFN